MRNFLQFIVAAALLFALLKVLVLLAEPKLTFFPYRHIQKTPGDYGIEFQELNFPTEDGETLNAWFLDRPERSAYLLFFHGNGGNISAGCIDYVVALYRRGYSVFLFDYRGYGKSSGSPSEEGLYADSRAAVAYFWRAVGQRHAPVVYLGHSLGGVAAASGAAHLEPDGIVLQGTFPDKQTLLTCYPFFYILGLLSRYKLSTLDFTQAVSCPALVIHGDQDHVVPLSVGKTLFDRLKLEKDFYLVRNGGHADLHLVGGEEYWDKLRGFVGRLKSRN